MLSIVAGCLLIFAPTLFIGDVGNIYITMFLKSMLPIFLCGFYLFGLADLVNI